MIAVDRETAVAVGVADGGLGMIMNEAVLAESRLNVKSLAVEFAGLCPEAACSITEICADCAVRRVSLCGALADRTLRELNRIGVRRHIAQGQSIAWAGEDSQSCANLLSGMMKLTASTSDGREQIVGVAYPGDFIGQLYAEQAEFTVTALSDAEICAFPRRSFERVLEENQPLERELLRRTLEMLDTARRQVLMLARQSASERLAEFLLRTADRLGGVQAFPGGPMTFDLPLSRGAIANVLGLTIETVSRQMTRLKANGVIALPGRRAVTILRRAELEIIAGMN